MFSRILVPVDGSELSQNAVTWAERLAVSGPAELFLLRVVQPLAGLFAVRPTPALLAAAAKEQQREIKAVTTKLSNVAHELHGRDIVASRYVQLGVPALSIAGFIEEHDIELVVMGTHGRGGVRRAILGSVADEVCRATSTPVLLIPHHTESPMGDLPVLICLDGSPQSESALDVGLTLAGMLGAPVTLLEVAEDLARSGAAADYLQAKAELVAATGRPVSTIVGHGEPGPDILLQAEIIQAAIIVMASHGRSGLSRAVLGSVASQVVAATRVPMLLSHRSQAAGANETMAASLRATSNGTAPEAAEQPGEDLLGAGTSGLQRLARPASCDHVSLNPTFA